LSADRSIPAALLAAVTLSACSAFAPEPHEGASFHQRIETKDDADFRVSTAALSGEESRRFLGVNLERKGVRAIWVEIENRSEQGAWYFPIGTDPAYFAPYEVAYMFRSRYRRGARPVDSSTPTTGREPATSGSRSSTTARSASSASSPRCRERGGTSRRSTSPSSTRHPR
jgi:hypothetical protein